MRPICSICTMERGKPSNRRLSDSWHVAAGAAIALLAVKISKQVKSDLSMGPASLTLQPAP
ncbi:hypothetical protein XFF6990_90137 [Xanthomonas citri pv. fuscans]|nr:hypothetical protein XFF6990_90137 [Xanthomonas citri pv. fuscans]